jgi:hypothetical protein
VINTKECHSQASTHIIKMEEPRERFNRCRSWRGVS